MALQSKLFSGDTKLEAAATSDPDHILQGANGPHVTKIQQALVQLDGAKIKQDGAYGKGTAAAVLAFKRKRKILNFKGKLDDIVGKLTMARLDAEMLAREGGTPTPPFPRPRRPVPPTPRRPVPVPPPVPTPQVFPPVVLEFGSTRWGFSFFGNKGFTGKGNYTLRIFSAELQDSRQFSIDEQSSSGDLLAGFKGECSGGFTTTKRIAASRFSSAACRFNLGKLLGSELLQGTMSL